jgi:hypothetical protein
LFSGATEKMCHHVPRFLPIGVRDPVHAQQG